MQGRSKPSLFLIPTIASMLMMAISMPALADKKMPKGLMGQEYTSAEENNKQVTPLRHSGEAIRASEVEQAAPQAERLRPRDNRWDNRQGNAQAEQSREENPRVAIYQREQNNRQVIAQQQQAERQAAAERIALLRENSNEQRNHRGNQNERPDVRTNGRHSDRQYQGNYGSPENPIAFKPARPEANAQQWQDQHRQANDYQRHLNQQNIVAIRFNERLRDQNRHEQYRSQQRYYERMNQQRRYYNDHHDDYYNAAYYNSPIIYRYHRGGSYHYANRYQADLMRQAINYGYEEGFHAGRADRMDRWGYNFREAYAYQDANYGYNGYYVDRGTYNYYFREGFRRGYDDGYYSRYQYGRHYNNRYIPHSSVLNLILNFSNWR